jgi:hypothetical protein
MNRRRLLVPEGPLVPQPQAVGVVPHPQAVGVVPQPQAVGVVPQPQAVGVVPRAERRAGARRQLFPEEEFEGGDGEAIPPRRLELDDGEAWR